MKISFWGVRGSIATPLRPHQVESRISAVVSRIKASDLESAESREAFIANLPPFLKGNVGGNTTCIEITLDDGTEIIIDAGSGIRELGNSIMAKKRPIKNFNIFFTHFHWDHINGLPFFDPAYIPGNRLNFYSPLENFQTYLQNQMQFPYFPVTMDVMNAEKHYYRLKERQLELGSATIQWRPVKHPGGCISYKFTENGKSFIFSTDTELTEKDFRKTEENIKFYGNCDILVLDSQYTLEEAIEKYDWGHSSYSLAVDFAAEWRIPTLVLFHHEPKYNDKKVFGIQKSARWYSRHLENSPQNIYLAREGLEFKL